MLIMAIGEKDTVVYQFYKKHGVIGYWRKANAIHAWFVKNVQWGEDDCKKYSLWLEDLNDLLRVCGKILIDKNLAPELLPTQPGFFFGSTEYDFWYYKEIRYTYELCKFLLQNLEEREDNLCFKYDSSNWDARVEYQASW